MFAAETAGGAPEIQARDDLDCPALKPVFPEHAERIDSVLRRPAAAWRVHRVEVIHETVASDHRPVLRNRLCPAGF